MQPRSRRKPPTDVAERGNLDTSSQSSQDDLDADDMNDKGPTVRRSALALPKPSSEGLSKQLWYAGPISQMNKQKSKPDSTVARRSVSPSSDRRNKLQPRSPGAGSGIAARRTAGSRGSMEDLLDADDSALGVRSRAAKSDEGIGNRTQLKGKSKAQNLQQPQGNVVARRSKLTTPSLNSPKGVVAR
ncbi:Hypothetical predicted protein [Paramuricea clavata]|uniref:Uncharacterized protein n=1 Tax=Paramuricea clavata TaxID=317549 RepID=A0A6S7KVE5_PARCT|nr:Hypothetical predicted protein [Paramuricea clavata]